MYIDFHSHILPGIDDGATSVEMSLEMLKIAQENDAEIVALTPHVDASSNFTEFLHVRNEKYAELCSAIKKENLSVPELLIGAEVLLDSSLAEKEDVRLLCLEGTELLLIELPYVPWNSWYNREIYNIISKHNVMPVMAHIERYIKTPGDIKKLDPLISLGVKFQINASSFMSFSGRRVIRELAADGLISAIASDAHNLSGRSPDISKPLDKMAKKFGPEFIDYLYEKTYSLLSNYRIK